MPYPEEFKIYIKMMIALRQQLYLRRMFEDGPTEKEKQKGQWIKKMLESR